MKNKIILLLFLNFFNSNSFFYNNFIKNNKFFWGNLIFQILIKFSANRNPRIKIRFKKKIKIIENFRIFLNNHNLKIDILIPLFIKFLTIYSINFNKNYNTSFKRNFLTFSLLYLSRFIREYLNE